VSQIIIGRRWGRKTAILEVTAPGSDKVARLGTSDSAFDNVRDEEHNHRI